MSNLFKVFKVNNKDTRMGSGASVVDYEHILQFILMLLLNSNKKMLVGSGKLIVSDNFFSKL